MSGQALDDIKLINLLRTSLGGAQMISDTLGAAASRGAKSKPTVAELNAIVDLTQGIMTRLRAALAEIESSR